MPVAAAVEGDRRRRRVGGGRGRASGSRPRPADTLAGADPIRRAAAARTVAARAQAGAGTGRADARVEGSPVGHGQGASPVGRLAPWTSGRRDDHHPTGPARTGPKGPWTHGASTRPDRRAVDGAADPRCSLTAVDALRTESLTKRYGRPRLRTAPGRLRDRRADGRLDPRQRRRDLRVPRAERGRQEHDDPAAARLPPPDRRPGGGPRARQRAGLGPDPRPGRLPARRHRPVRRADRRATCSTTSASCTAGRRSGGPS